MKNQSHPGCVAKLAGSYKTLHSRLQFAARALAVRTGAGDRAAQVPLPRELTAEN